MNLNLLIDTLVLDGLKLSHRDRLRFSAAVNVELSRLFSEGNVSSLLRAGGALSSISGPALDLPPHPTPTELGHCVARSIYGAIGR